MSGQCNRSDWFLACARSFGRTTGTRAFDPFDRVVYMGGRGELYNAWCGVHVVSIQASYVLACDRIQQRTRRLLALCVHNVDRPLEEATQVPRCLASVNRTQQVTASVRRHEVLAGMLIPKT